MLATVGRRLVDVVGEMGIVGHVASDEFVLVLKDPTRIQDQAELGESVRVRVEEPIDTDLYLSCSIGVSCLPDNAASADELLRQAESAMRRAKAEGRNTVFAFASEHQQELKDRLALGVRLKQAVRAGEFTLHYQPRINGHDWRVAGFEALLRWHHPEFGLLLPARFLGVAEDLELRRVDALEERRVGVRRILRDRRQRGDRDSGGQQAVVTQTHSCLREGRPNSRGYRRDAIATSG